MITLTTEELKAYQYDTRKEEITGSRVIGYAIRDGGYISLYDYKANREPLYRARVWKNLPNVDRYLTTDSYRRTAKHSRGDWVIEEVSEQSLLITSRSTNINSHGNGTHTVSYGEWMTYPSTRRVITGVIRTLPASQVQADADRASTRAERRSRGLIH